LRIVWSERSLIHLGAIGDYLQQQSPAASNRILNAIARGVEGLADHPRRGRPGRIKGTRELVVTRTRYLVAYRLQNEEIEILAVIHGARRWPIRL
jgi:toxin ParE1/3/4